MPDLSGGQIAARESNGSEGGWQPDNSPATDGADSSQGLVDGDRESVAVFSLP